MKIRKARRAEAEICYSFINDAREYHAQLGFVQWHEGYPVLKTIIDDVNAGIGYAFVDENDNPIGYFCIIVGDEPAYKVIEGAWLNDNPMQLSIGWLLVKVPGAGDYLAKQLT